MRRGERSDPDGRYAPPGHWGHVVGLDHDEGDGDLMSEEIDVGLRLVADDDPDGTVETDSVATLPNVFDVAISREVYSELPIGLPVSDIVVDPQWLKAMEAQALHAAEGDDPGLGDVMQTTFFDLDSGEEDVRNGPMPTGPGSNGWRDGHSVR